MYGIVSFDRYPSNNMSGVFFPIYPWSLRSNLLYRMGDIVGGIRGSVQSPGILKSDKDLP